MADPQPARNGAPSDALPISKWMDLRRIGGAIGDEYRQILQDETAGLVGEANEPVGAARAMLHAGEGLLGGLGFLSRLFDPDDARDSPKGEAAWDSVFNTGRRMIDYGKEVWRDPLKLDADIHQKAVNDRVNVDPNATPRAPSFRDEVSRQAEIGRNRGERDFNFRTSFLGGAGIKGLTGLGAAKSLTTADYLAAGYTPRQVADLFSPYTRLGHHAVALKDTEGWPTWMRNHPVVMVKRPGATKAQANEDHYRVDRYFHGAGVKKDPAGPKGWSGQRLGLSKYNPLNQLIFGTPLPLQIAEAAIPGGSLFFNWGTGDNQNGPAKPAGVQNRHPR